MRWPAVKQLFRVRRHEPNAQKATNRPDANLTRGSRIRERRVLEKKIVDVEDNVSFGDDFGKRNEDEVKNWRYHLTNQHF